MIDLILTIICSSSIAVILKINSVKNWDSMQLIAGNYFAASVLGLIFYAQEPVPFSMDLALIGMSAGVLFVASIFAFSKSVTYSGGAISTLSSRLSVFVPVILSMLIYLELPSLFQSFGLLVTAVTIYLFYLSVQRNNKDVDGLKKFLFLIAVLLGIGLADFYMKIFQANFHPSQKAFFLFIIFTSAFVISFTVMILRRIRFNKKSAALGIIMGIPNILSSHFLINALDKFSAVYVYPVVNMAIIIVTATVVRIFWKETWNVYSTAALLTGIAAIVLLNL
ncbi:MAG: hypothetical protein K8F36_04930 [Melioribacteraceae bacterium]|nr:hypothetical protein [Melioribacteraceae bacterium]